MLNQNLNEFFVCIPCGNKMLAPGVLGQVLDFLFPDSSGTVLRNRWASYISAIVLEPVSS